jgi:hypothetical protein
MIRTNLFSLSNRVIILDQWLFFKQSPSVLWCRWFPQAAGSFYNVPFLGGVSALSLSVAPFALTFAILWGVYRNNSFAWIGQDVLVRTPSHTLKPPPVLEPTSKLHSVELECMLSRCRFVSLGCDCCYDCSSTSDRFILAVAM